MRPCLLGTPRRTPRIAHLDPRKPLNQTNHAMTRYSMSTYFTFGLYNTIIAVLEEIASNRSTGGCQ